MKKLSTLLLITCSSALFFSGCKVLNVNSYEREQSRAAPNIVNDSRYEADSSLKKVAVLVRLNETVTDGGNLLVQADVQNQTRKTKTLIYKFEWFDGDGILMESVGGWKALRINGGETISLQGVAPNERAVDFRIKLRES